MFKVVRTKQIPTKLIYSAWARNFRNWTGNCTFIPKPQAAKVYCSQSLTLSYRSSGDKKYQLSVPRTVTIAELKALVEAESEIPADRQKLIYSGKVLKDGDPLSTYNVQSGHTIHLVKSPVPKSSQPAPAAAPVAAGATGGSAESSVPSNIAAGQGAFNPLAGLTGARYAGANIPLPSSSMFGPDGGMGALPDENQMAEMMENPMFQESMRSVLADPQMLDYLINQSPQLRSMGPQARQMLQSDYFRNMMTNPQMMRQVMDMQRMMGGLGGQGAGAASIFPAPGATSTTTGGDGAATVGTDSTSGSTLGSAPAATTGSDPAANPFAALLGGNAAGANPFAMFAPQGDAAGAASGAANPFFNPDLMNMLMGGGAGAGAGAAAAPADTRPPEERYESQLRQLNDMGFSDFERNVRALRRSGGSVQGALDALLNGDV
ncbi:unnamed protein product [Kuraishia capsulata CBS 1993]|uniref:Ubiquitin-like domain-containing protein n=1 Tax=Kuraishia capsulata CBS 1993 TaxID=1382522 RepID=W6MMP7_9ASCO|nr:uncharacterized protein KUCA_T00003820001 [Kuraishia capsulata CBS 1993]CDK27841.1 unnamed protein product [Kuraishia capsulata CBS 1993]